MPDAGLRVQDLVCCRGHSRILQGVTLEVVSGIVGLIGRNGMGKTTLAECVMGMLPAVSGSVRLDGVELAGKRPDQVARAGLALVPQGRRLFRSLTVAEHLSMARSTGTRWTPNRVRELFPRLAERERNRARQLSGGEQQMLAIGRALLQNPAVLIMDEPSEGLAPVIVDELAEAIIALAGEGMPILMIEQNLSLVERAVTQPIQVMENGKILEEVDVMRLHNDRRIRERILGVAVDLEDPGLHSSPRHDDHKE